MGEELYQLRWQHFQGNIRDNFRDLREGAELQDVTLHVGGQVVGAHKVVLATISPYFHSLLTSLPPHTATHPLLLMPKDVTHGEVLRMLDYIYYGEVSLPAREVPRFLEVAAQFQIKGLKEDPAPPDTGGEGGHQESRRVRRSSQTMRSVGLLCPSCSHMCRDVSDLKSHMAEYHSKPRPRCDVCDQEFPSPAALEEHAVVHYSARGHDRPVGSVAPHTRTIPPPGTKVAPGRPRSGERPLPSPQPSPHQHLAPRPSSRTSTPHPPSQPPAKRRRRSEDMAATLSHRCHYGQGCTYRLRTLDARRTHARKHLDPALTWCNTCCFFIKANMFVGHKCRKAGV